MADFAPLLSRAIASLDPNTPETRRALYDRARSALVAQLRGLDPPPSEADITRERLGLEEAIRRIEAEYPRIPRQPESAPAKPAPAEAAPHRPPAARAEPASRPAEREAARGDQAAGYARPGAGAAPAETRPPKDLAARAAAEPRAAQAPAGVPAEPEPAAPEPAAAPPDAEPPLPPWRQQVPSPFEPLPDGDEAQAPEHHRPKIEPRTPRRPQFEIEMAEDRSAGRSRLWVVIAGVVMLLLVAAGGSLMVIPGGLNVFGGGEQAEAPQPAPPAERPKITDRVTQDAPRAPAAQPGTPQAEQTAPAVQVAQRAILYEEDPTAGQQGQVLIGTVAWRTETVTPGPGLAPDLAIVAEIQVPDRRMSATVTLKRNVDQALPASHTIELIFVTPADFPFGGVAKVPGILAKRAEGQRGAPLAGLAVDVTAGFFIVGLSAIEADVQRNLQLLKDRAWMDIPLVYRNGRRAILSIEKGVPGDRVFADAFGAWGQ